MHSEIHQDSIPGYLTSKKISFFSQSMAAFPHCCFPNSLADYDDWSIKPPLTPRITQLAIAVVNYRLDNCDSLFFCQNQNNLLLFFCIQCFCKRFGWQGYNINVCPSLHCKLQVFQLSAAIPSSNLKSFGFMQLLLRGM